MRQAPSSQARKGPQLGLIAGTMLSLLGIITIAAGLGRDVRPLGNLPWQTLLEGIVTLAVLTLTGGLALVT